MEELTGGNLTGNGSLNDSGSNNMWNTIDYSSEYSTSTQQTVEYDSNNDAFIPDIGMSEHKPLDDVNENVNLSNQICVNTVLPHSISTNEEPFV